MDNTVDNIEFANAQVDKLNLPSVNIGDPTTVSLMQEKLRQEEPNCEVYDYKITQLPPDQIVPASTVRDIAIEIFTHACLSRLTVDRRDWSDDKHREAVLRLDSKYEQFSRTHPRLVLALTAKDCDKKKLTHIMNLIQIRENQEGSSKTLEEQKAEVGAYFKQNFVRPALPGEEEERVANGTGYRASVVHK